MTTQPIQPPAGLLEKVLLAVETEQRKTARRRFVLSSAGLLVLSILLIPAIKGFGTELMQSGFVSFFSLAFVNFTAVFSNWQDFALSLLESFPVVSAIEVLTLLGLMVASVSALITYSKTLLNRHLALT